MKLYLSGPMTGLPEFNYPAFHEAKTALSEFGYEVISPADLPIRDDWEWVDYILVDIGSVFAVDGVATLDGWQASKGARIECRIATERGLAVRSVGSWLVAASEVAGGTSKHVPQDVLPAPASSSEDRPGGHDETGPRA